MSVTNIEWADHVWNCVTGCTKVSQGCKHCFAEKVADRFFATQYAPVPIGPPLPDGGPTAWRERRFTDVQTHEDRLLAPLSWRKPARVFVNSMSDLFHEDVPDAFIDRVFSVMALAARHSFLVLTKRPERMRDYLAGSDVAIRWLAAIYHDMASRPETDDQAYQESDAARWQTGGLPNVWLGVSAEDQITADTRIPILLKTPASIRFVSYEPAIGPVVFKQQNPDGTWPPGAPQPDVAWLRHKNWPDDYGYWSTGLNWIIVGGESGPGARPFYVDWARAVVQQGRAANVPVFVKQLGADPRARCLHCGRDVGRGVQGGFVDACGPEHAGLIRAMVPIRSRKGGEPTEWPEDLRVRQFPGERA